MNLLLGDDIDNAMDNVYVFISTTMLSNKRFDIDKDVFIIIDNVRYIDTSGLYKLIFKRFLHEAIFTEDTNKRIKVLTIINECSQA